MEIGTKSTAVMDKQEQPPVSLDCFKNTVLFSCSVSRWGNKAKCKDPVALEDYLRILNGKSAGDTVTGAEAGADPKRVTASKVLVRSEALDTLGDELRKIKKAAMGMAMPSFIRGGSYIVKRDRIPALVELIKAGREQIEETHLPAFLNDYNDAKERSRINPVVPSEEERKQGITPGLGPLWLDSDYPAPEVLRKKFAVRYSFFALTVPEGLPPEVRAEEERKLRAQFEDAAQSIRDALRVMFAKLLDNAVDKLSVKPGEKPKRFNDSLVGNLAEFFETFEARNITSDAELAGLVEKCKATLSGVSPDKLRTDWDFKTSVGAKLEEIKAAIDPMIEEIEERAFDFSDE